MKNIVLVGFMGTGKTASAKALAERLNMRYVSIDAMIEEREGIPISGIFSKKGEPYFRDLETRVAKDLSKDSNTVIDAGGGIVSREENITALRKGGVLIALTATVDKILERTKGRTHRPLLNVPDPRSKIEELLKTRAPLYAKADFKIDTSNLTVNEIVEEIVKFVNAILTRLE